MSTSRAIAMLAAAAVFGAAGGAAVVGIAGDGGTRTTTVAVPAHAASGSGGTTTPGAAMSASEIYEHAKGSVVFVTARTTAPSPSPFAPQQAEPGEATGSGFVISRDGFIVTNAHVVDGATEVTVKIGDREEQRATLVGQDASTDLALLKVAGVGGLRPLALGDSDEVVVGDPTFAIGNPYGLDRTLTTGVVSALQRQITAPNGFSIDGVIQTDAPINPGNSGGPLLDGQGEVIGVNSQILTGSSGGNGNVGIGFAVPSNTVRNVVEQLRADGEVEHAYLGVQMATPSSGDGALVAAVTSDGPADDAGLRVGDVVVAFDGERIEDPSALASKVNASRVGEEATVTIDRGGERLTVTVRLGAQPASARASARQQRGEGRVDPRDLLEQLIP